MVELITCNLQDIKVMNISRFVRVAIVSTRNWGHNGEKKKFVSNKINGLKYRTLGWLTQRTDRCRISDPFEFDFTEMFVINFFAKISKPFGIFDI